MDIFMLQANFALYVRFGKTHFMYCRKKK